MMRFWRDNIWAAAALTLIRILLGYQWLTAGWHKITGAQPFDATGFLNRALANPVLDKATGEAVYPTFNVFLEAFVLPNIKLINVLIPYGELLIGLGLILGTLTAIAAFFGLLMNFMFMFAGTVSTNPWLMLLGIMVVIAGTNAGRFGLDHYVLPLLHKVIEHMFHRNPKDPITGTKFRH